MISEFLSPIAAAFERPLWRFATSGTLITLYLVADLVARRRPRVWRTPHGPRWVHLLVAVSVTAFYVLIGPTGGPLLGGLGNLIGGALAALAIALRFSSRVRYPEMAGRTLLYIALPLATGVPLGWLVLSLPACVTSYVCARRADRMLHGDLGPARSLPPHRVIPGIW
jgi:hypothetical protein